MCSWCSCSSCRPNNLTFESSCRQPNASNTSKGQAGGISLWLCTHTHTLMNTSLKSLKYAKVKCTTIHTHTHTRAHSNWMKHKIPFWWMAIGWTTPAQLLFENHAFHRDTLTHSQDTLGSSGSNSFGDERSVFFSDWSSSTQWRLPFPRNCL